MKKLQGNTVGEVYGPAMEITDQAEAADYFQQLVARSMREYPLATREEIETIVRDSLGYAAGYCTPETRQRVQRLFGAVHPIFGSLKS